VSWLSRNWSKLAKGVLSVIPGGGVIATGLDLAESVADAIGGEAGSKIAEGAKILQEGLESANSQSLPPEVQERIQEAAMQHQERMAELGIESQRIELEDTQGGRDLAKTEIESEDEYVRRTRPMLLRVFGIGSLVLVAAIVAVGTAAAFLADLSQTQASFLIEVYQWALTGILGAFFMMFRAYVGARSNEKIAESTGSMPLTFMDRLLQLKGKK